VEVGPPANRPGRDRAEHHARPDPRNPPAAGRLARSHAPAGRHVRGSRSQPSRCWPRSSLSNHQILRPCCWALSA
jgi:hypothetical protein